MQSSSSFLGSLRQSPERLFLVLLATLTIIRVALLFATDIDLGPDETQYWWWSKSLEFGYFSKPPMIGWVIWLSTSIFGDSEWAVRFLSPFIIAVTSWLIYRIADHLYGATVAFWSGIAWMTLPVISFASTIISTDIPLLFFWCLGIFALLQLATSQKTIWAVVLGLAIGLGLLSKYAMMYFPLCMVLAAVFSDTPRKAFTLKNIAITAVVGGLIFLPNILWNAANEFQTLAHTQENASWGEGMFNFDELSEFFFAQFGIGGPILFGALLWGLATIRKRRSDSTENASHDLFLLSFALPPVLIICVQAFISQANANWAMTGYPAIIILVTSWLLRAKSSTLVKSSVGLHVIIGLLFMVVATDFSLADKLGRSNDVKRVRAWQEQANEIATYATDYPVIVVSDRELMGHLLYYLRDLDKPIRAWDVNKKVEYHYEAFDVYDPSKYENALYVNKYPEALKHFVEFGNIRQLGVSEMDLNTRCNRIYGLYELSAYNPTRTFADVDPSLAAIQPDPECRPY